MSDKHDVDSFDAGSATTREIVDSLKRNGGCFLRNFLGVEDVDRLNKELRPYLEADEPWEGDFFPRETRRVYGLAGKSPLYMEKIPSNTLYQSVCDEFLTTKTTIWVGNKQETNVSLPQINSCLVLAIGPGGRAQPLHRDDTLHHNVNPQVTAAEYTTMRETALGLFVAGVKCTKANGATRFIPGSHLDASGSGPPDESKAVYAELEKGDAFLMLASCYHGGSANTTDDQARILFGMFMTRGTLRQEENQFIANPVEKVRELPEKVQRMLGYSVSEPFCGWVDLKDPIHVLRGDKSVPADGAAAVVAS